MIIIIINNNNYSNRNNIISIRIIIMENKNKNNSNSFEMFKRQQNNSNTFLKPIYTHPQPFHCIHLLYKWLSFKGFKKSYLQQYNYNNNKSSYKHKLATSCILCKWRWATLLSCWQLQVCPSLSVHVSVFTSIWQTVDATYWMPSTSSWCMNLFPCLLVQQQQQQSQQQ